jgi:peptidoglycan/LPS O-acetylase OafA/YrhL
MRYNPALDGLRALAVLLVISSHTMRFFSPGGWIGVDVFFTLSGYLITSILLRELRETGRISFGNFYIRRALRLTPALAILLVIFEFLRSFFVANGSEIREAALVAGTYIENWNLVFNLWPTDFVGQTWSLAVEEQFYLLWPLMLIFIFNKRPVVWISAAIAAMLVARLVFWRGGTADTERALQYSLGIRPVGLLIGCILAFLPIDRWKISAPIAPTMMSVIVAIALIDERSVYVFLIAPMVVSLATAVLVACTLHGGATISALSLPPVRYIGKISYGLYLYHSPIFFIGEAHKVHLPFYLYGLALIALVFSAAALSYEFVEKPFLRLKDRFQGKCVAVPLAVAAE